MGLVISISSAISDGFESLGCSYSEEPAVLAPRIIDKSGYSPPTSSIACNLLIKGLQVSFRACRDNVRIHASSTEKAAAAAALGGFRRV